MNGAAPANIVGQPVVDRLAASGFVIVPVVSTAKMNHAASQAMRRMRDADPDAAWMSNKQKAAVRWEAMINASAEVTP